MQQYFLQLVKLLENKEYKKLNPESNNVYGRTCGDTVYVVVIGSSHGLNSKSLKAFNSKIITDLSENTRMKIELLNILLTPDGMFDDVTKDIVASVDNVWLFTEDYGRLYVFENQPEDFDGLYSVIDKKTEIEHEKYITRIKRLFGVVTPILVVLNIVIYIISVMNTDEYGNSIIVSALANNMNDVLVNHEYYRLFTAMFVHLGLTHLFSNMIVLIALGARVENLVGKTMMIISYTFTGIAASIVSIVFSGNDYTYSAGASGAVFGLIGIMITFAVFNKGRISDLSLWNLAVLSILTIINGYVSNENIDNAAHVGGLIAGLLIGLFIVLINQKVVKKHTI